MLRHCLIFKLTEIMTGLKDEKDAIHVILNRDWIKFSCWIKDELKNTHRQQKELFAIGIGICNRRC